MEGLIQGEGGKKDQLGELGRVAVIPRRVRRGGLIREIKGGSPTRELGGVLGGGDQRSFSTG